MPPAQTGLLIIKLLVKPPLQPISQPVGRQHLVRQRDRSNKTSVPPLARCRARARRRPRPRRRGRGRPRREQPLRHHLLGPSIRWKRLWSAALSTISRLAAASPPNSRAPCSQTARATIARLAVGVAREQHAVLALGVAAERVQKHRLLALRRGGAQPALQVRVERADVRRRLRALVQPELAAVALRVPVVVEVREPRDRAAGGVELLLEARAAGLQLDVAVVDVARDQRAGL